MAASADAASASDRLKIETTNGSILHRLAGYLRAGEAGTGPSPTKIYLIALAITFLPLLAAALVSPLPVAARSPSLRLPFLYDWNVMFMFLVSFPCLAVLTLTDQAALVSSLEKVQRDGTVVASLPGAQDLSERWRSRFTMANVMAQVTGLATGLILAYCNYRTYAPARVGFWIARDGTLLLVGYVFLWCIFAFYALIPLYVFRCAATSLFLRDLVAHTQLRMLPFHPDHCGGLRPVGRLGLRNQYALTVFGLNVVLLVVISLYYLQVPSSLYGLIIAAGIAYLVLGPVVFIGPLLPFRAAMLRTKADLLSAVARRLRVELQGMQGKLSTGTITKDEEELVDRLRKVGAVIDELPVWPFDAGTLRKFATAYLLPLLGAVSSPVITALLEYAAPWLHPSP